MSRTRLRGTLLLLTFAGMSLAHGASPGNLDELLEQTRSARQHEAQMNVEREKRFIAEREKRAELLNTARTELAAQRARTASLSGSFDAGEKKLAELQAQLDAR
jgi:biopolymer transport protein ExbB